MFSGKTENVPPKENASPSKLMCFPMTECVLGKEICIRGREFGVGTENVFSERR